MTQMSGKEFWLQVQLSPAEQGRRKEEEGDSWSIILSYTILLISCSCLVYQLLSFQPPGKSELICMLTLGEDSGTCGLSRQQDGDVEIKFWLPQVLVPKANHSSSHATHHTAPNMTVLWIIF